MDKSSRSRTFGLAGVIVGLLSLALAIFHFIAGPLEPPTLKSTLVDIAQIAKGVIVSKMSDGALSLPMTQSGPGLDVKMIYTIMLSGFIAIVCSLFAIVRREAWPPIYLALALGGGVLVWQISMIVAAIYLMIFIIMVVMIFIAQYL